MKYVPLMFGLVAALISNLSYSAETKVHPFFPFVVIDSSVTESIEIRANQHLFPLIYSSPKQAFPPLEIPFEVVSVTGGVLGYRLTLPTSVHQCDEVGEFGVNVTLDEQTWPTSGLDFIDSSRQHRMKLVFDPVYQDSEKALQCTGVLRVQVEVTSV